MICTMKRALVMMPTKEQSVYTTYAAGVCSGEWSCLIIDRNHLLVSLSEKRPNGGCARGTSRSIGERGQQ